MYPCAITKGPKSYFSIDSRYLKTQKFQCEFSKNIDENYLLNYEWFINGKTIGHVTENSAKSHFAKISYDNHLRR